MIKKVNDSNWKEWTLENICIDFVVGEFLFTDSYEKKYVRFLCKAYIGLELLGHWDESEISSISIKFSGDVIDKSLDLVHQRYREAPSPGGGERLTNSSWIQLNITLSDGLCIKVACMEIDVKIK